MSYTFAKKNDKYKLVKKVTAKPKQADMMAAMESYQKTLKGAS
jgi:hypothetical protein